MLTPNASFVTFYSFKGGVGRSMALINTAAILAGRGFRVLVIDLDLEAPGLSYLDPDAPDVESPAPVPSARSQPGFIDLLIDAKERGPEADLFTQSPAELVQRYTRSYRLPEGLGEFADGSLSIMPAGRFDGDYAARLDALNLPQLYQDGVGEPLIRAFKKRLAEAGIYDYVLVDSRTGFSDEAGICTRDLADQLMVVSGLNRQNIEGTAGFLSTLRASTNGDKRIQIVLSPVPNGEDDLLEKREAAALAAFREAWGADVDLSLRIPYHPQLALTEEPHIFRRRRGYLFDAYRAIERGLLRLLGHEAWPLKRQITEQLEKGQYGQAKQELDRLVRLEGGREALTMMVAGFGSTQERSHSAIRGPRSPDGAVLERLLSDTEGHSVLKIIVDNLETDSWTIPGFVERLSEDDFDLAFRIYERCLQRPSGAIRVANSFLTLVERKVKEVDRAEQYLSRALQLSPNHPELRAGYARFLQTRRRDFDRAEQHFEAALASAPQDGWVLYQFAKFIEDCRGDFDRAEKQYMAAIAADPTDVFSLQTYAAFLAERRGDPQRAEQYHQMALEAEPANGFVLSWYARFLEDWSGDLNRAEELYIRALELHSDDALSLGDYALFLWRRRNDQQGAEVHFKRAQEATPQSFNVESNYGQMLISVGRIQEGFALLSLSYDHHDRFHDGNLAELCFALWLASLMSGRDATLWEGRFKFLIEHGFERHSWSFDSMLEQAKKVLPAEDLDYAHALAQAFLDSKKAAVLERHERWRAVTALEPTWPT